MIFSGGLGAITKHLWPDPEANRFARIAIEWACPKTESWSKIDRRIPARTSSSPRDCCAREGRPRPVHPRPEALYGAPHFATFQKVWPGKSVIVTSPQFSLDDTSRATRTSRCPPDDVISIMVGDLQRIREYPARRVSDPQDIPGRRVGRVRGTRSRRVRQVLVEGVTTASTERFTQRPHGIK